MKTILERMCGITELMPNPEHQRTILINEENLKKAEGELSSLRETLKMDTMEVLILTAILHLSSRYKIDADDISSFLGLEYLKFLTFDSQMEDLKKRGYIRIDREGDVHIPKEVLNCLKKNQVVEPEPVSGLSCAKLLGRIKKILNICSDDEMTTEETFHEIMALLQNNPETSISRAFFSYLGTFIPETEGLVFFGLICRYWYDNDDQVGWHDFRRLFSDEELDDLMSTCAIDTLVLQVNGIIEYVGVDGLVSKDYFHIKDDIKEEIFADLGGCRKKEKKVSSSRKVEAATITRKELFYNEAEGKQVAQLKELLSDTRFNGIREKMKAKGMRTGFTCLFYGGPGTGKTETVYQIARECGRDLFFVDVSQIKSMWVGESEKNIKDVFNKYRSCVKDGGKVPILLFNEADAIFGVRQEGAERAVEKMENSIQNIILQKMEDLDGILIATTNLTANLDKAFERRFLYKIRFDKPSLEARTSIWRSMLPDLSQTEAEMLATAFDFSGGQIENGARKKEVSALIGMTEPGFEQIRQFCSEEIIGDEKRPRRIGF